MSKLVRRLRGAAVAGGAAVVTALGYYTTLDVQKKFELASATGPLLRTLDAEDSHRLGILAAKWGLFPRETRPDPDCLRVQLWGRTFPNPIGLAAGFDKDAEAIKGLMGLGLGFMEVGSVTPKPQPGNDKPRVFRLPELKATINRYGFNSAGADAAAHHLESFWKRVEHHPDIKPGVLGVNLGKNKLSEDAADDYAIGLMKLGKYADFVVINVSSPNTPGLRALQGRQQLQDLVTFVKTTRDNLDWGPGGPPPLLVKIAPDVSDADKADIAAVVAATQVDGLVVGNTTISRPGAVAEHPQGGEAGGLSGPPLLSLSTQVLADMYRLTGGKVPLIGCGGVSSGEDAYAKIRAGASLVELYTALAYEGPAVVPAIKQQLAECLARDGFANVADAVGADHKAAGGGLKRSRSWGRGG
uniref:Dihydroorotate dehydrogenase (quinone), mitochondrial n=1 Tax=Tetradesmus obliquus TaxID=3088 RepID=A0A383V1S4_TETOB|eukprot:jgi/Sobl393_1/7740/SZX59508.1